jgi:hypothetical protein
MKELPAKKKLRFASFKVMYQSFVPVINGMNSFFG